GPVTHRAIAVSDGASQLPGFTLRGCTKIITCRNGNDGDSPCLIAALASSITVPLAMPQQPPLTAANGSPVGGLNELLHASAANTSDRLTTVVFIRESSLAIYLVGTTLGSSALRAGNAVLDPGSKEVRYECRGREVQLDRACYGFRCIDAGHRDVA